MFSTVARVSGFSGKGVCLNAKEGIDNAVFA